MEPVTLGPVDRVEVLILVDNSIDLTLGGSDLVARARWGQGEVHAPMMQGAVGPDGLRAEHGYSALVTIHKHGRTHRILFDTGMTVHGMTENMHRLDVDPSAVEVVVLSHGHYDHTMGFNGLVESLGGTVSLPVYLHPDAWRRRRIRIPGGPVNDLPTASKPALEGAGFEIREDVQPSFLFERSMLVTGEVDRTTSYEAGMPNQEYWTGDAWAPDPDVPDDQALVVDIAGAGLLVLSGCGHSGIVNTARYASRLTGRPIHAIVGGFHLGGASNAPAIPHTVADLVDIDPALIVPGHCSGWRARSAIADAFGDRYQPSAVGSRITLDRQDG